MMNRMLSLRSAVMLAFVHFLLELWRAFLDFSLVLPQFADGKASNLALYGLVYTLIFAGWLLALKRAQSGGRGGLIGAIALGVLFWLGVDLGTIFFYCPGGCEEAFFDVATYIAIVIGGVSLLGLVRGLRAAGVLQPE